MQNQGSAKREDIRYIILIKIILHNMLLRSHAKLSVLIDWNTTVILTYTVIYNNKFLPEL